MMGTGEASGDNRALRSAEAAISNPLMDDFSLRGARGLLISITGGKDLTLPKPLRASARRSIPTPTSLSAQLLKKASMA
jgi:cell division protein FtsZ